MPSWRALAAPSPRACHGKPREEGAAPPELVSRDATGELQQAIAAEVVLLENVCGRRHSPRLSACPPRPCCEWRSRHGAAHRRSEGGRASSYPRAKPLARPRHRARGGAQSWSSLRSRTSSGGQGPASFLLLQQSALQRRFSWASTAPSSLPRRCHGRQRSRNHTGTTRARHFTAATAWATPWLSQIGSPPGRPYMPIEW
jgi:hypothetical protein